MKDAMTRIIKRAIVSMITDVRISVSISFVTRETPIKF